jgi:L-lactate dehydrogenase complex protein LldG
MTTARDDILRRVRAAKGGPATAPPADYRRWSALDRAQLVERFCERVADYQADVRRASAAGLGSELRSCLKSRDARVVGIPPGLPEAWRPIGVELLEDRGLTAPELDHLDAVVTGCTAAIAETGTIILASGPAEGRRALTLVPDVHVCIVQEPQILGGVPEAIAALDGLVKATRRPLTLVSGPSATSDIELARVEGVHGPRTLVVLVVPTE